MNFFGIGLPEMAVIAAVGLLVFGPKRLPELGRTLGRTLKGFQSASREFEQEFRQAIDTETVTPRAPDPIEGRAHESVALTTEADASAPSPAVPLTALDSSVSLDRPALLEQPSVEPSSGQRSPQPPPAAELASPEPASPELSSSELTSAEPLADPERKAPGQFSTESPSPSLPSPPA